MIELSTAERELLSRILSEGSVPIRRTESLTQDNKHIRRVETGLSDAEVRALDTLLFHGLVQKRFQKVTRMGRDELSESDEQAVLTVQGMSTLFALSGGTP